MYRLSVCLASKSHKMASMNPQKTLNMFDISEKILWGLFLPVGCILFCYIFFSPQVHQVIPNCKQHRSSNNTVQLLFVDFLSLMLAANSNVEKKKKDSIQRFMRLNISWCLYLSDHSGFSKKFNKEYWIKMAQPDIQFSKLTVFLWVQFTEGQRWATVNTSKSQIAFLKTTLFQYHSGNAALSSFSFSWC